jgi:hypothetical protein
MSSFTAQQRLGDIHDEIAAIYRTFPELAAVFARQRWIARRQRSTARAAMLRRLRRALAVSR